MYSIYHTLKGMVKRVVTFLPKGTVLLERLAQLKKRVKMRLNKAEHQDVDLTNQNLPTKDLFARYYQENYWGNAESVSGGGSTLAYTENIRREIPRLVKEHGIQRFLDAPCGDYNWFQKVEKPLGMKYIGADIVDDLIAQNRLKYGDEQTTFISLDIINDRLPQADLWMCRDCLFHFSYEDIFKTLDNFVNSEIEYLFTSVHTNCTENTDILTGGVRLLNLELPPFNLCKPIVYIDDWIPNFHVRKMGLWTRAMIADSLASAVRPEK